MEDEEEEPKEESTALVPLDGTTPKSAGHATGPQVAMWRTHQNVNGDWVLSSWTSDGVQINEVLLPDLPAGQQQWTLMNAHDGASAHVWAGGGCPPPLPYLYDQSCSLFISNPKVSCQSSHATAAPTQEKQECCSRFKSCECHWDSKAFQVVARDESP